ncbi:SHOCT domain-containing protein [Actinoplanes sp. NPDC051513]|uniref:SHOCT domain-containing protein n=1 Tax=Actinoplanes sp. NPDC051513 TaxID=3363908 RepID=UPI0037BC4CDB
MPALPGASSTAKRRPGVSIIEAMQRRTAQLKWETHRQTHSRTGSSEGTADFVTSPSPTPDRTQALARFVSLRDAGAISEEEFAALQARLH